MTRRWRAYHAELDGEPGTRLTLSADESHHIRRVLRLVAGDALIVFDGRGLLRAARVVQATGAGVVVELGETLEDRAASPLDVRLYQGLCRPDRMEWVIQKATELGVAAIHPLACERAERVKASAQRADRWRRIALEACKQSGRGRVPLLESAGDLPAPAGCLALLLDADPTAPPLGRARASVRPSSVLLAVGPEAGFTDAERARWTGAGWQPVSLGPRILRTETAGVTAAALALHIWGDLGSGAV